MLSLTRRRLLGSTAVAVAAPAVLPAAGRAQAWPAKQIRMIAPYPPGGGVDTVTRAFSEGLAQRLGQTIVVDNQPGAGATIGAAQLARSPADGYTLMVGSLVDYSIAPYFHENLTFDMTKDFLPVVEISNGTIGVLVTPSLPVKDVKELIAYAKANPGKLSYASSGFGGLIHLNYEMLKQMTGAEMTHVPYKGTSFFQGDLYENRVQVSIDNVLAHLPHIASGKVRCLAVTSAARSPLLPDVPTMAEAAPAGTPADIIDRANKALNAALGSAEVSEKLALVGDAPLRMSPAQFTRYVADQREAWGERVRIAGIEPQ